jgi:hypothetical protein
MMISDKRKHNRREIMSTIEYFDGPFTTHETFDGVVVNVSESGLCILTTHLLNKGQKIEIRGNVDAGPQSAIVRWALKRNSLYYKVGLKFTK